MALLNELTLRSITLELNVAQSALRIGDQKTAVAFMRDALSQARCNLPSDVPKFRCLRAHIVSGLEALK